jgi:hypothetical protein
LKFRTKIAARLLVTHILLPIILVAASAYIKNCNFLILSIAATTTIVIYFTGYWEFFGIKFKQVFFSVLDLSIVSILVYKLMRDPVGITDLYLLIPLIVIQLYLLYQLIKIIFVFVHKDTLFLDIEFPFKNGTYLITDGGNSKVSRLMNYHYYSPIHKKNKTNLSMLYATDIVKIQKSWLGWLPKKNEEYPIFNESIYSPVDGKVVMVVNNINDNDPFAEKYPYNTGNTIVIQKDNYYLLLGHIKKKSILVKEGDLVHTKDLIATVGNSGWTERPHIHIQLIKSDSINYWSGIGVEIRFKNQALVKNKLIKN